MTKSERVSIRDSTIYHFCELDIDNQIVIRYRLNFWQVISDVGDYHDGLMLILGVFLRPYAAIYFYKDFVQDSKKVTNSKSFKRVLEKFAHLDESQNGKETIVSSDKV